MTLQALAVNHPAAGTPADAPAPFGAVDPASAGLPDLSFARVMVQANSPKSLPPASGTPLEVSFTDTITSQDQAAEEPTSTPVNTPTPATAISPTAGGTSSELGQPLCLAGFAPPPIPPGPTSAAPSTHAPDTSVPWSGPDLKPRSSGDLLPPLLAGGHRPNLTPAIQRPGSLTGEIWTGATGRSVALDTQAMAEPIPAHPQAHPLPQALGVQSNSEAVPGRPRMTETHPMGSGTRLVARPTPAITPAGADTSPSAAPFAEALYASASSGRETPRPDAEPATQNSASVVKETLPRLPEPGAQQTVDVVKDALARLTESAVQPTTGSGRDTLPRVPEPTVQQATVAGRDMLPRVPEPTVQQATVAGRDTLPRVPEQGVPNPQTVTTNHPGSRQPVPIDGESSAGGKPGGLAASDPPATIRVPAVLPGSRPIEAAAAAMVLNEAAATRPRVEPGTASARISVGMRSSVSQEQTAARAVQKLPVTVPIEPLGAPDRSVAFGSNGFTRPLPDRDRIAPLEFQTWEGMQRSLSVDPLRVEKGQGVLDDRMAASEPLAARLERAIMREVVSMRQLNADSMTVVLRPDPRSEIILHLRQHNGQMEASARCESASFQVLNREWGGLQESLAQLNVRLLPLERNPAPAAPQTHPAADNPGGSGDSSHHLADRSPRQHDLPNRGTEHERGDDLGHEGKPTPPARSQADRNARYPTAGWESWA